MALSDRKLLDVLSRTAFIHTVKLVGILGQPHPAVHWALTDLVADGIAAQVNHGTELTRLGLW